MLGPAAEATMVVRLRDVCGLPVVASGASAVAALRASGARRVTLVHPPWFEDEIDALGLRYFGDQGFDVSLAKATGVPGDPAEVRPEHVVEWVVEHVGRGTDAVFIGGNGFRAAGAVEELERRTGLLVLEANQVLLWSALAATGTTRDVPGHGRLLLSAPADPG